MGEVRRQKSEVRRHRGFFLIDALIGLLLIGVLATLLAVTADRTSRAQRRLADDRAATRAAERVLVSLQAGTPLQPPGDDTKILVQRLDTETADRVWVRVTATVAGRPATLYGLVAAPAADQATKTYGEARP